jgi:hypothetical protein
MPNQSGIFGGSSLAYLYAFVASIPATLIIFDLKPELFGNNTRTLTKTWGGRMERTEEQAEMVELDQAVEELGTTSLRLLMLLREGTVEGVEQEDGSWLIARASLERLKERGGVPQAKQKGCASSCTSSNCGCS